MTRRSAAPLRKSRPVAASEAHTAARRAGRGLAERWRPWLVFAWSCVVALLSLAANPLARLPVSVLFFGDSPTYLEQARRLVAGGELLNFGLPFHPPAGSWLLVPLWWLTSPPAVFVAAKLLMGLLQAATFALFYRLIRERVGGAFWICLLLPLSFDELTLGSAVSSEVPYRFLLVCLLSLGWRWPLLAGLLHAAAALLRVEHLGVMAVLAVLGLRRRERWRAVALAAAAALAVLVPHGLATHRTLVAYNQVHAGSLAEPLPEWVPISFYGPLNFALAMREEGIHFSRRTLPSPPGEPAVLDPTFRPHNEAIVHGYRLGWQAIAAAPGRFVGRTFAKVVASLAAVAPGWTWRDLPKPARWVRQPVDIAAATSPGYLILCLGLAGVGLWALRGDRQLLAWGLGLVAFRLLVNAAFFPYLRGMLIAGPFLVLLVLSGLRQLTGRYGDRLLQGLLVALALFQLATTWTGQRYQLDGERGADGAILDDRPVIVTLEP